MGEGVGGGHGGVEVNSGYKYASLVTVITVIHHQSNGDTCKEMEPGEKPPYFFLKKHATRAR